MQSWILVRWFEIRQRSNLDRKRTPVILIQGHHSFPATLKITPRIGYKHLSDRVPCFKKVRLTSRMPAFTSSVLFSVRCFMSTSKLSMMPSSVSSSSLPQTFKLVSNFPVSSLLEFADGHGLRSLAQSHAHSCRIFTFQEN